MRLQTLNEEVYAVKTGFVCLSLGLVLGASSVANANLLLNGNLDVTYDQEIIPGFFLPKPDIWINEGFRSITGAYEDEMSSEPWAGPAPTPVTTDGINGDDWAVFFKPFLGDTQTNGLATGHLYQDVAGTAGLIYTLTGWAGAESNAMMADAVLALEFLDGTGGVISSSALSLMPTLFVANGQSFNYKLYTVSGTAPVGTAFVRSRISMIDGQGNPAGGGQAFVVDDFELQAVPEPATLAALGLGAIALMRRRRRA